MTSLRQAPPIASRFLLLLLFATACRHRPQATPPALSQQTNFIDLKVGWRLRVVEPLLRDGSSGPALKTENATGSELVLRADDRFLGYELSFWSVKAVGQNCLALHLSSREFHGDAGPSSIESKLEPLFRTFAGCGHFRLLFLASQSASDHNMAVLYSHKTPELESLSERVLRNPADCRSDHGSHCLWIPAGIAVRPEMHRSPDGIWVDAGN